MENIYAIMIFEVMGRPAEYIKETLSQLVEKIQSEKGCKLEEKRVFEPKLAEHHKDIFTTFAEVEAHFEKIEDLLRVIFTYMPSHIDIVRPQNSAVTNAEMNYIVNELAVMLHKYDEIAKRMMIENDALKKYAEALQTKQQALQPVQEKFIEKDGKDDKEEIAQKKPKKKHTVKKKKKENKIVVPSELEEKPLAEEKIDETLEEEPSLAKADPEQIYDKEIKTMSEEEEEYLEDIDEVLEGDEDEESGIKG